MANRAQFDEAVGELYRSGQPIEAPALGMLAAWDMDLEDEAGPPKLDWVQRNRPLIMQHYAFNVEQTAVPR